MDDYLNCLVIERDEGRIRLRSPAKINLFLEPLRKRPDGYHEIVTVMQTIDFCDELEIELVGEGLALECAQADVPSGPENLVWRAADAFRVAAGVESGARIRLTKRIPLGGGLGGGSSNAAITLLGLNELVGRPLGAGPACSVSWVGRDVFSVWGNGALPGSWRAGETAQAGAGILGCPGDAPDSHLCGRGLQQGQF
jgi:4-diphosphocytidyl-2C-methyl-D-erythritol kinase